MCCREGIVQIMMMRKSCVAKRHHAISNGIVAVPLGSISISKYGISPIISLARLQVAAPFFTVEFECKKVRPIFGEIR